MNRRSFLSNVVTGGIIAGAGMLGGVGLMEFLPEVAQAIKINTKSFLDLLRSENAETPEGAIEITLKADALADSIESLYPPQFRTLLDAQMFVYEVGPYAVYERILPAQFNFNQDGGPRQMVASRANLPEVEVKHYGGDSSFHLLGTANCYTPDGSFSQGNFNVNIRYFNPMSPLYNRPSSMNSVLIHELMHMQGVCTTEDLKLNPDVETATQLATLEVLAAMTNHGNVYGLLPFIREIQGYAADVVYLWALENDNVDFYRERVLKHTVSSKFRMASFEKSFAHWSESYSQSFRLIEILSRYGVTPYLYLLEALRHPKLETRRMPYPNGKKKIVLDDTAYVLDHMVELTRDYHLLKQPPPSVGPIE